MHDDLLDEEGNFRRYRSSDYFAAEREKGVLNQEEKEERLQNQLRRWENQIHQINKDRENRKQK